MGVGLRIFIVNDDNSLVRLALTRYERLMQRDPDISFPQYAGKRVQYVEAAIEYKQRKPFKILRILFLIMSFDPEGRIDITEKKKESRLAAETYPFYTNKELPNGILDLPKGVIDARYIFARKRLNYEYRWRPTQEIEAAIIKAIFG